MIQHPSFPGAEEIFREMTSGQNMPKRCDGQPETDEERRAVQAHVRELAKDPDQIRILCIGCRCEVPLLQSAACACGGFVCASCQRVEEDGICDHNDEDP
jgi:hypothetical protein